MKKLLLLTLLITAAPLYGATILVKNSGKQQTMTVSYWNQYSGDITTTNTYTIKTGNNNNFDVPLNSDDDQISKISFANQEFNGQQIINYAAAHGNTVTFVINSSNAVSLK
jgi:hypothetical protein